MSEPGARTEAPLGGGARSFLVDERRRVLASDAPDLPIGEVIGVTSWLGQATIDAIDAASARGQSSPRVARDYARDTHWVVHAAVLSEDPWRARVVALDATPAVESDRAAVLGKIVHSSRNVGAALLSVLEALELDRPTGDELTKYLSHLRDPAERLSITMKHLAACVVPPAPVLRDETVGIVIERALGRVSPSCKPERLSIRDPGRVLSCDAELLAESVVAMLESGGEDSTPSLGVDEIFVGKSPSVLVLVERDVSPADERALASIWDLSGAQRAELPLRLSYARAIARAHGGYVIAESAGKGRLRLGVVLPQVAPLVTSPATPRITTG